MQTISCNAKTRSGKPCKNYAMPNGKCRMHGGKSTGATPKHGRYSKIGNERVKELDDWLKSSDSNPLDATEELSLARAYLVDYLDRLEENNEGIMRWHASFQDDYKKAFTLWRERMITLTEEGWQDLEENDLPLPPDPLDYVDKPRKLLDASDAIRWIDTITKIVERIEKIKLTKAITTETMQGVTGAMKERMISTLKRELDDSTAIRIGSAITSEWAAMRLDTVTGRVLN